MGVGVERQLEALLGVGRMMEKDRSAAVRIAAQWLKVRDRQGRFRRLVAIVAQRAFEANSKTVTTFDSVTQQAINMIR